MFIVQVSGFEKIAFDFFYRSDKEQLQLFFLPVFSVTEKLTGSGLEKLTTYGTTQGGIPYPLGGRGPNQNLPILVLLSFLAFAKTVGFSFKHKHM